MAQSLFSRPTKETARAIIETFFGDDQNIPELGHFDSYLDFYMKELSRLDFGARPRLTRDHVTVVRSHGDIIHIAGILRANQSSTRPHIRSLLSSPQGRFPSVASHEIDRAVDLTLRLWLMLNVRSPDPRLLTPQTPLLQWDDTTTLEQFVGKQFPKSSSDLQAKASRLDSFFTASFMVKTCGLKLDFTPMLENHLSLECTGSKKTLRVYPYKACLKGYQPKSPFPDNLLRETILTLNMLFPHWDPCTDKVLKKHGQTFHDLAPFDGPRTLNLNEFDYWRQRLLELHEEVHLSPPVSLQQLWSDQRNPLQWSTFWTAQVILALTLVSCVASLVQAWASLKTLQFQQGGV